MRAALSPAGRRSPWAPGHRFPSHDMDVCSPHAGSSRRGSDTQQARLGQPPNRRLSDGAAAIDRCHRRRPQLPSRRQHGDLKRRRPDVKRRLAFRGPIHSKTPTARSCRTAQLWTFFDLPAPLTPDRGAAKSAPLSLPGHHPAIHRRRPPGRDLNCCTSKTNANGCTTDANAPAQVAGSKALLNILAAQR